ncbi:hypothetical protein TcCL_Unassigned02450 [Trypanosoma cruzi]|nr:hypothetical protein TcCL_Unassigned02450 [Trypanosoma cruzi]
MLLFALLCVAVVDPCVVCVAQKQSCLRAHFSVRWLQRVAVTLCSRRICCHAFTCVLLGGQCAGGCAIAGWRERSGRKCVSAAVKGRAGFLAAEGIAHPAQHRSCRAPSHYAAS